MQASVNRNESPLRGKTCADADNFNAYEGCLRSVASATCSYLPGFTQNMWAAVIRPLYVPFGSFILTEAQSLPPDCFISSSTEYKWHFLNHISLDILREGNLKKRTQKRVRMIILLNKKNNNKNMQTFTHKTTHCVWLFIAKIHSHDNDGVRISRKNRWS